jgi:hypothetical protein
VVSETPTEPRDELIARAVIDPWTFCTSFCKTPLYGVPTLLPAHEYFREHARAWAMQENERIEKTRQMTVSWWTCGLLYWDLWTPTHVNWPAAAMSYAEKLVDDNTQDSLFGKMKYIHDHLDEDLAAPIRFNNLEIVNLATGSFAVGKSTTKKSGRGGNYRRFVQDEAAFIEHSREVYGAMRPGTPTGFVQLSTPMGKGNNFYDTKASNDFTHIRMHWRDHPDRACKPDCPNPLSDDYADHLKSCWYYKACESLNFDKVRIARELNISYEESVGGRAFYAFGQHNIADVAYNPGEQVWRFWDFGSGGTTAIHFCHVRNLHTASGRLKRAIREFDFYENHGHGARHYRDVCQKKWEQWGRPPVLDIGDPWSLNAKESDEGSWALSLSDGSHPYVVRVEPSGCVGKSMDTIIQSAQAFFGVIECQGGEHVARFLVDRRLRKVIEHYEGWAYACDDNGVPIGTKPKHDEHSHACTALCFGCYSLDPADTPQFDYRREDYATVGLPEREPAKW